MVGKTDFHIRQLNGMCTVNTIQPLHFHSGHNMTYEETYKKICKAVVS